MPKHVNEAERARPTSLSLTAEHIFILEKLGDKTVGRQAEASRKAIVNAGAAAGIHTYTTVAGKKCPTEEFAEWLRLRGWDG